MDVAAAIAASSSGSEIGATVSGETRAVWVEDEDLRREIQKNFRQTVAGMTGMWGEDGYNICPQRAARTDNQAAMAHARFFGITETMYAGSGYMSPARALETTVRQGTRRSTAPKAVIHSGQRGGMRDENGISHLLRFPSAA